MTALYELKALDELNHTLVACRRCPRLVAHRQRIAREKRRAYRDHTYWGKPVPSGGDPRARVLLVGLAPGAHGANRTGRMFTGDGSGDFLTPALHRAGFANQPTSSHIGDGLKLRDLYIVAVAHCAPPDNKPSRQEIANCRPYLVKHLRLLRRVRVIVALGRVAFDGVLAALEAAGVALPTPRPVFAHGAVYHVGAYTLVASYHPSRQNTQTGRLTRAMLDAVFRRARGYLDADYTEPRG
jgi:uracil-DNA glycosylase family 4